MKPSKMRRKADDRAAYDAAYRYKNNPFEEGSRVWKMCERHRARKSYFDSLEEDMEEIYGKFATNRRIIDNKPGSFYGKMMPA